METSDFRVYRFKSHAVVDISLAHATQAHDSSRHERASVVRETVVRGRVCEVVQIPRPGVEVLSEKVDEVLARVEALASIRQHEGVCAPRDEVRVDQCRNRRVGLPRALIIGIGAAEEAGPPHGVDAKVLDT
jgi:hypothetical protein